MRASASASSSTPRSAGISRSTVAPPQSLSAEGASSSGPSQQQQEQEQQQSQGLGALDKVLAALLSERGHSLVSLAVSMGANNMVRAYCETTHRLAVEDRGLAPEAQPLDATDRMLDFLSTPRGQRLAVMAVASFVSNGMRVYMDKSMEVNVYEDLLSSMAKPQHLEAIKACIAVFARDFVSAYMRGGDGQGEGEEEATVTRCELCVCVPGLCEGWDSEEGRFVV